MNFRPHIVHSHDWHAAFAPLWLRSSYRDDPVFAGTRAPFDALLDYIEGGKTLGEFLDDFPTVTRNAAIAALEQAKALVATQL